MMTEPTQHATEQREADEGAQMRAECAREQQIAAYQREAIARMLDSIRAGQDR